MKSSATLQRRVLGVPTGQGVRARAVEKVQRQLAELPEETGPTGGWRSVLQMAYIETIEAAIEADHVEISAERFGNY